MGPTNKNLCFRAFSQVNNEIAKASANSNGDEAVVRNFNGFGLLTPLLGRQLSLLMNEKRSNNWLILFR